MPPQIINDRVMVPLRAISEAFGSEVTWEHEQGRIDVYQTTPDGYTQIAMFINDPTAHIRDYITIYNSFQERPPMTMDVPPIIVDNRTLVPLRFISELFNRDVFWIETGRAVVIETPDYQTDDQFMFERVPFNYLDHPYKVLWTYANQDAEVFRLINTLEEFKDLFEFYDEDKFTQEYFERYSIINIGFETSSISESLYLIEIDKYREYYQLLIFIYSPEIMLPAIGELGALIEIDKQYLNSNPIFVSFVGVAEIFFYL